jgi:hypothetical protein
MSSVKSLEKGLLEKAKAGGHDEISWICWSCPVRVAHKIFVDPSHPERKGRIGGLVNMG